jgi:hypothetical protein
MNVANKSENFKINRIEACDQQLSGRGGLSLIMRYIEKIGLLNGFENTMGHFRQSPKGAKIPCLIKQILAHGIDGSHFSISSFDALKEDSSYASILEIPSEKLISSDTVKRFFGKINYGRFQHFRSILQKLFVWRLLIEKPETIILDLDTMVLDNDDAKRREGCKVTYKKKKGYQPLQLCWGSLIVDTIFRSGEKHSNYSNNVQTIIEKAVLTIRNNYDSKVPIILTTDSGFLSEENFQFFEDELKIGYICMGKLYKSITEKVASLPHDAFEKREIKKNCYYFHEFESKLDSWEKTRRTIYSAKATNEDQLLLEFARPESVIYTNINNMQASKILELAHGRGESELNNRSLKEFMGTEHLPFKNFGKNGGWYYMKVIGHFIMECYRKDVASTVIPRRCYPNTFRRKLIDFAVKVIRHSGNVVLKINRVVFKQIQINQLWKACNDPIPIPL